VERAQRGTASQGHWNKEQKQLQVSSGNQVYEDKLGHGATFLNIYI
jgi:hypothetical protein